MQTIENEFLTVEIAETGAQLHAITDKKTGQQYLWDGNPDVWPKQAPNLFPSIGKTFNDHYLYNGKTYEMPHHGFVAEEVFSAEKNSENAVTMSTSANDRTRAFFPFAFKLSLTYELSGRDLSLTSHVINQDNKDFSFSLGAHPGFALPVSDDISFEDFYLTFAPTQEKLSYHEIAFHDNFPYRSGQLKNVAEFTNDRLPLTRPLFNDGLIILAAENHLTQVTLKSDKSDYQVTVDLGNYPECCIWTKTDPAATFICIEPFYGRPDTYAQQELLAKPGNALLKAHNSRQFFTKFSF
ncbi:aldose 1-epimerase family protein [Enterococcus timonensis]|uniref:aldose 1-epimerase family protein n=1 Tax=Enterococcus timonensis TaxID=1852364 RepID=UPI0008D9366D|nr:aldose 1-epimerase family protein [Enterococcus timonensis]